MSEALPQRQVEDVATRPQLPADLEAALVELLAEALVAELMVAENPAETQGVMPATVVSPAGLNREEVRHGDHQN